MSVIYLYYSAILNIIDRLVLTKVSSLESSLYIISFYIFFL